jgi:hypothetical protein
MENKMQDLTQLKDEQLETYRSDLLIELDRRNRLRDIPNDIKKMAGLPPVLLTP